MFLNKAVRLTALAAFCSLAWPQAAPAQNANEERTFDLAIRLKHYIARYMNDDTVVQNRRTVFAMLLPGIPITEATQATPDPDPMPAWVLNTLPSTDLTGHTSTMNMVEIYRRVLFGTVGTDGNDLGVLSPEKEVELKQIHQELAQLTKDYFAGQLEYLRKSELYETAVKKSGIGSASANLAKAEQDLALMNWTTTGKKDAYETADVKLKNIVLEGKEPWRLWKIRFPANANVPNPNVNTDYGVVVWPPYKSWPDESGWTEITIDANSLFQNVQTGRDYASWQASGRTGFLGLGKANANGKYEKTWSFTRGEVEGMKFRLKVKRVLTYRTWGDPAVFRSASWKWRAGVGDQDVVSGGKWNAEKGHFEGDMPLYPTSLILAKDAEITSKFDNATRDEIKKTLEANTSGSFLGLASGGKNIQKDRTNLLVLNNDGSATLKFPGIQLIGYICEVLPKSPANQQEERRDPLEGLNPNGL